MRSFSNSIVCALVFTPTVAAANATAFVFLEGYDPLSGISGPGLNPSGLETLNSTLRTAFVGENFYSRLFQWDQVNEAANYINLFEPEVDIYMVGYSRGGQSLIDVASAVGSRPIARTIQLDPVNCGASVIGCALTTVPDVDVEFEFAWPPVSVSIDDGPIAVESVGTQTIPGNVGSATSYYQKVGSTDLATGDFGDRIQGEDAVGNATNVDAEAVFGGRITHLNIDDDAQVRQTLLEDMRGYLTDSRLMKGLGGSAGFGQLAMTRNDDGSTNALNLPFEIEFGGETQSDFWINNNGNITFDGPFGAYTPQGFQGLNADMIAPFWADVDTRCGGCGEVYVAAPTADTLVVTWDSVGYYSENSNLTNTFQMILRDRYDLEGNVFDIEFRYDNISWTTGDASGGSGGFGGTPGFAGYTGGTNNGPQQLFGSGSANIAGIDNTTNIGKSGKYWFQIADGNSPGTTSDNPLLPDVIDGTWNFRYTTTDIDEVVWSDPEVAVGYDYQGISDTLFTSFILPENIGDGVYDLAVYVGGDIQIISEDVLGGEQYFFADFGFSEGLSFFRIGDIEIDAGLDPNDVTAFVTGLTFASLGEQTWSQSPIVVDTDPSVGAAVPIPAPLTLLLTGLGVIGLLRVGPRAVRLGTRT